MADATKITAKGAAGAFAMSAGRAVLSTARSKGASAVSGAVQAVVPGTVAARASSTAHAASGGSSRSYAAYSGPAAAMPATNKVKGSSVQQSVDAMSDRLYAGLSAVNQNVASVVGSVSRVEAASASISGKLDHTNVLLARMAGYLDRASYDRPAAPASRPTANDNVQRIGQKPGILPSIASSLASAAIPAAEGAGIGAAVLAGARGLLSSFAKAVPTLLTGAMAGTAAGAAVALSNKDEVGLHDPAMIAAAAKAGKAMGPLPFKKKSEPVVGPTPNTEAGIAVKQQRLEESGKGDSRSISITGDSITIKGNSIRFDGPVSFGGAGGGSAGSSGGYSQAPSALGQSGLPGGGNDYGAGAPGSGTQGGSRGGSDGGASQSASPSPIGAQGGSGGSSSAVPGSKAGTVASEVPAVGRAFLDAIAGGESKSYHDINYKAGGGQFQGDQHPFAGQKGNTSAGRYQDLASTWSGIQKKYGLNDFSPKSQDIGNWKHAGDIYKQKTGGDLETDLKNPAMHGQIANALHSTWISLNPNSFAQRMGAASKNYVDGPNGGSSVRPQDPNAPAGLVDPSKSRGTTPSGDPATLAARAADLADSHSGGDSRHGWNAHVNNADIQQYLKTGGHGMDPSKIAWCAAYVGSTLRQSGLKDSGSNVATSYMKWGQGVDDPSKIKKGDVLVQNRGLGAGSVGGHVLMSTGGTRIGPNGQLQLETVSGNSGGNGPHDHNVSHSWIDANSAVARRATERELLNPGAPGAKSAPGISLPQNPVAAAQRGVGPAAIEDGGTGGRSSKARISGTAWDAQAVGPATAEDGAQVASRPFIRQMSGPAWDAQAVGPATAEDGAQVASRPFIRQMSGPAWDADASGVRPAQSPMGTAPFPPTGPSATAQAPDGTIDPTYAEPQTVFSHDFAKRTEMGLPSANIVRPIDPSYLPSVDPTDYQSAAPPPSPARSDTESRPNAPGWAQNDKGSQNADQRDWSKGAKSDDFKEYYFS